VRKLILASIMLVLSLGYAEAKSHHRHHSHHYSHHRGHGYDSGSIVAHPAGCPRTSFCGCGASAKIFGHPVRDLYLASNWFRFPRAAAAPGMAAVRSHHVFVILDVLGGGMVNAYDANSGGHQTRVHHISLAGYTVVNPHGSKVAVRERRHHVRIAHSHHHRVRYAGA